MPLGAARLGFLAKSVATATAAAITGLKAIDPQNTYYQLSSVSTRTASAVGGLTVSFWVKWLNISGQHDLWAAQTSTGAGGFAPLTAVELYNGRVRPFHYSNASTRTLDWDITDQQNLGFDYGNGFWDGEWHHYVFSCSTSDPGSQWHCYIDGIDYSGISVELSSGNTAANHSAFNEYTQQGIFTNRLGIYYASLPIAQLYIDDTFLNLGDRANRLKFYNPGVGPVDMGTDGTGSGLAKPLIFHQGDTSTFNTNGGDTDSYAYADEFSSDSDSVGSSHDMADEANGPTGPLVIRSTSIRDSAAVWTSDGATGTSGTKKFGSNSIYYQGGSKKTSYMDIGNTVTGDGRIDDDEIWCLEFWFRGNGTLSGAYEYVAMSTNSGDFTFESFPSGSNNICMHAYDGKVHFELGGSEQNSGYTISDNTWTHIAIQCDGNRNVCAWINGAVEVQKSSSTIANKGSVYFGIGHSGEGSAPSSSYYHYFDDIRFTYGTMRYQMGQPFTPPVEAFTNDNITAALFHCESTSQTDDDS